MPHIHKKIDFTVEVFVVYKDKVLLRKHDKYDIWLSVGGHIELDENPNQAAIQEVKEEVGLDVELSDTLLSFKKNTSEYTELIPPTFLNIHTISNTHRHIGMTYFAKSNSGEVIPENDTNEWRWVTQGELNEPDIKLSNEVIHYARTALEEFAT